MTKPSGTFTFNSSFVCILSTESLLIYKKCPVVPGSTIAILLFLGTAVIYEYGFNVVFSTSLSSTISFFIVLFEVYTFCLLEIQKLMSSVMSSVSRIL